MPGVVVNTAVRSGPATRTSVASSTLFVVGLTERGPSSEARVINSFEEFEATYGGYVSYGYVHPTAQTFFEEGGSRLCVGRVVGPSATTGTLVLDDAESNPTITLTAIGPGSWSDNLTVTVEHHPTNDTFKIILYLDGTQVYTTGYRATPAAAVDAINTSPIAEQYVTATNDLSSATAPNNNPAEITTVALSVGDDNQGSITYVHWENALDLFTPDLGPGAVATPGLGLANTVTDLLEHAVANNRIVIGSFGETDSANDAISEMADYTDLANAEYLGMYWPWVQITTSNGTFLIPPDGFVAAKRAQVHNTIGSWSAGAGSAARAAFVNGLATTVSAATAQSLDDERINALRIIQGSVRVYGARSASENEDDWRYITYRDFLNDLSYRCTEALEDLVFSNIDGRRSLFGRIEARLVAILEPIRRDGGFYEAFDANGNQIDAGYSVEVSDAINPASQLANGLVVARVGVRISGVGDRIELTITKSNLTSTIV